VLDPGQVCSEEVFYIILSTVHLKYHEDLFLFDEEAFPVVHGNSCLYRVINEDLFIEGLCILANGLRFQSGHFQFIAEFVKVRDRNLSWQLYEGNSD
jgi:hypothetical protein